MESKSIRGIVETYSVGKGGIRIENKWYNPVDNIAKDFIKDISNGYEIELFLSDAGDYITGAVLVAPKEESKHLKKDEGLITNLQGKEYTTHKGLLKKAIELDIEEITTELITETTADIIVFKATAKKGNKIFTGYGDASDLNVNANIKPHKIRMAETRAINRALRLFTGDGSCSIEEMSE